MSKNRIAQTATQPASNGTRAFRVVLRSDVHNTCTPYVVHMETDPDTAGAGFHNGDYCETLAHAFVAYVKRCTRYGLTPLDAMGKPIVSLGDAQRLIDEMAQPTCH